MRPERWCWLGGLGAAALVALSSSVLAAPDMEKKADGGRIPAREMRPKDAVDSNRGKPSMEPDGKKRGDERGTDKERSSSGEGRVRDPGGPAASGSAEAHGVGSRGGLSDQSDIGKSTERRNQRLARIRELKTRWGAESLKQTNVQNELRHHAWRLARLKRMRDLALQKKNEKLVARIDQLEQKENARHERAMAREKASGAAAGPAGSAVPSGSAAPRGKEGVRESRPPKPAGSAQGEHGGRP